jgi:signal peptidase I
MDKRIKDILEWVYCIIIALVLALLFRYFIGTPTIVKQRSMYPTLKEGQRLILNRTFRITKKIPNRGDIITFEAPTKDYKDWEVDQTNPVAIYENVPKGIFEKFVYYSLEITKRSYIKRAVAFPGEHVKIENGKVYINGKELEESYLNDDVVTESRHFNDFIVPDGYIFAMGDNRTKSTDCREFGCIPMDKIEGIVCFRFWPLNVFGKVE